MKFKDIAKVMAILFFTAGSFLFGMGYHNMDLCFNVVNMGLDVVDLGPLGQVQTMQEGYLSGVRMLMVSFSFFLIAFLILIAVTVL